MDLADFEVLSICYYNSGVPADCPIAAIARLDFNYDAEINDLDLQAFAAACTGPQFGLFADGDWNSNGSVGPVDHNKFVNVCYSGPGGGFNTNGCQVFDFDGDTDVDLDDYGVLLALWYEASPNAPMTLTAADASPVNDYYFTGRSLDFMPHGGERHQRYYYRARTYNTERFMQRDPLEYVDSRNLLAYALSNPCVYTDPDGQDIYHLRQKGCHSYVFVHDTRLWVATREDAPRPAAATGAKKRVRLWPDGEACGILWLLDTTKAAAAGLMANQELPAAADLSGYEFVDGLYYAERVGNAFVSYDLLPAGTALRRGGGRLWGLPNAIVAIFITKGVVTKEEWPEGKPNWLEIDRRQQDPIDDWASIVHLERQMMSPSWFGIIGLRNCWGWASGSSLFGWDPPSPPPPPQGRSDGCTYLELGNMVFKHCSPD